MDTRIMIGIVLVCLVGGLGIGYLIGNITYPVPVADLRQQWAMLHIDAGGGSWNYTARYHVTWGAPFTIVNGPSETNLNITRPAEAPIAPSANAGWEIEVWATVTLINGNPITRAESVFVAVEWAGANGSFDDLRAYAVYPAEAHIIVHLS